MSASNVIPSHPHLLTFNPYAHNRFCDVCGKSGIPRAYQCKECSYDECEHCFLGTHPEPPYLTKKAHPHTLIFNAEVHNRFCDVCDGLGLTSSWCCDECQYDECVACHEGRPETRKEILDRMAAVMGAYILDDGSSPLPPLEMLSRKNVFSGLAELMGVSEADRPSLTAAMAAETTTKDELEAAAIAALPSIAASDDEEINELNRIAAAWLDPVTPDADILRGKNKIAALAAVANPELATRLVLEPTPNFKLQAPKRVVVTDAAAYIGTPCWRITVISAERRWLPFVLFVTAEWTLVKVSPAEIEAQRNSMLIVDEILYPALDEEVTARYLEKRVYAEIRAINAATGPAE